MTTENEIATLFLFLFLYFSLSCALLISTMSSFANRRKPRKIGGDDEERDEGSGQGWLNSRN